MSKLRLYDCKTAVRSTLKLLPEIKLILSKNDNRERLFRQTIFGPWLDIKSCDNDYLRMHYIIRPQFGRCTCGLVPAILAIHNESELLERLEGVYTFDSQELETKSFVGSWKSCWV